MTMDTLIKEKQLTRLPYIFRGLVHYHHGKTGQYEGRHGAGESENSTAWPADNSKWSESPGMA